MVKNNIEKFIVEVDSKLKKLSCEAKRLISAIQDANAKLDHVIWKLKENDNYSGLKSFYDDNLKQEEE